MPMDDNKIQLMVFVLLAETSVAIGLTWFSVKPAYWSALVAGLLAICAVTISLFGHFVTHLNETRTLFRIFLMINIIHLFVLYSRLQLVNGN